jgi:hypothetical protein
MYRESEWHVQCLPVTLGKAGITGAAFAVHFSGAPLH